MTVRTELEELVKWISELQAKAKGVPPTDLRGLTRKDWQLVDADLSEAATHFAQAHAALEEHAGGKIAAEFARDLEHETQALALRAQMLGRREALGQKNRRTRKATAKAATLQAANPTSKQPAKASAPPKSAATLVGSAQGAIQRAYRRFDEFVPPNAPAKGFLEELDVLSEMTLHLRQQCSALTDRKGEH